MFEKREKADKASTHDLKKLEYPRHLHREDGAYLKVTSPDDAEKAMKDGWLVEVPLTEAQQREKADFEAAAGETSDTGAATKAEAERAKAEADKAAAARAEAEAKAEEARVALDAKNQAAKTATELNAADTIAKVAAANRGELDRMEADEKSHAKYPGGRRSVLEAIAERRAELGPG